MNYLVGAGLAGDEASRNDTAALPDVMGAYPFDVVRLPAPSAFTAGRFCLGKTGENRSLPHPALRCAPVSFTRPAEVAVCGA